MDSDASLEELQDRFAIYARLSLYLSSRGSEEQKFNRTAALVIGSPDLV
jgi:hypothetical protein